MDHRHAVEKCDSRAQLPGQAGSNRFEFLGDCSAAFLCEVLVQAHTPVIEDHEEFFSGTIEKGFVDTNDTWVWPLLEPPQDANLSQRLFPMSQIVVITIV